MLCLLLMTTYGRLMVAHVLVMAAITRKGHAPSLVSTGNFFVGLLLIVVKVVILPLCT